MVRKKIYFQIMILCMLVLISSIFKIHTILADEATEGTYINPSAIMVSTPTLNSTQNEVSFSIENLTPEDKKLTIYIKSINNGITTEINEYALNLKTGTEKTQITLPAKIGDVISIYDDKDNYYIKPIEIKQQQWIATWASAQQGLDPSRGEYPPDPGLMNNTLRQVIRISNGGSQLRFTFSNEYGDTALELKSVHIAKPTGYGDSGIDTSTDKEVTFNGGSTSVSIPAGKSVTSDLVEFSANALERIAVSTCFGSVPSIVTSHTGSRTTTYLITDNHVSDASLANASTNEVWYFLSSIDVMANAYSKAVACLGDSTTDGRGVTVNQDNRWTDVLADRLQANSGTTDISVLNQGIGGNGLFGGLGPGANMRFERDILNQLGVKYAIIFEGINDIGSATDLSVADNMIEQYKNFVQQAHAKGIKIYGATITPFGGFTGYYDTQNGPLREKIRQKVNKFIREGKSFDGVIDFDAAVRDEETPLYLSPMYSSDGLHPNALGYKKLGECIDLTLFEK